MLETVPGEIGIPNRSVTMSDARGPLLREEMGRLQRRDRRAEPRPVLHRRDQPDRRGPGRDGPADAPAADQPVLNDLDGDRWEIEHLPDRRPDLGRVNKVPTAPAAHGRFMTGHLVRGGDSLKARTGMAGLPTRLPHPGLP